MSRTLIVARIRPGSESKVGRIFATSDSTDLPVELGVQERNLYSLHDIYVHVIDFSSSDGDSLAGARTLPGFRQISRDLAPYISPYDPAWTQPQDAVAKRFYHWRAPA
jgi:hypothetical protein